LKEGRSWVGAGPNGLAVTLFDDKLNKEAIAIPMMI
jgi:hypothetical protein